MKRYQPHITFLVAVLFSFPLVYQSLHQLEHVLPKSHCCEHHDTNELEVFSAPSSDEQHLPVITDLDEACPVCTYEHTAYNIPGALLKPACLSFRFRPHLDSYQGALRAFQIRTFSLRAPPVS